MQRRKYIPTTIHTFDNTYDELGKVKTQYMRRLDETGSPLRSHISITSRALETLL